MTRIHATKRILLNLQRRVTEDWGDLYMSYEHAYKRAIRYTGIDFGDDISKWQEWFTKYPDIVGLIYSTGSLKIQCLLLVKNLSNEISPKNRDEFVAPEQALALLVEKSGQNFGDNVDLWRDWISTNLHEDK